MKLSKTWFYFTLLQIYTNFKRFFAAANSKIRPQTSLVDSQHEESIHIKRDNKELIQKIDSLDLMNLPW